MLDPKEQVAKALAEVPEPGRKGKDAAPMTVEG